MILVLGMCMLTVGCEDQSRSATPDPQIPGWYVELDRSKEAQGERMRIILGHLVGSGEITGFQPDGEPPRLWVTEKFLAEDEQRHRQVLTLVYGYVAADRDDWGLEESDHIAVYGKRGETRMRIGRFSLSEGLILDR